MIIGVREPAMASAPPSKLATAAVAIVVRGHSEFAAIPTSRSSSAKPRVTRLIAYLAIV